MFTGNVKLLGPVIVALFAIVGLCLTTLVGMSAWVVMLIAMILCMLVGNPPRLLAFYFMWLVIGPLVNSMVDLTSIALFDKILTVLMLAVFLAHQIYHPKRLPEFKVPGRILIALLFLCLVSNIANQVPAKVSLHFVFLYFRFFVSFYFVGYFVKNGNFKVVLWAVTATLLVQVIPNIGWLLGFNPLPNRALGSEDFARGTIGSCDIVAYFCIFASLMFLSVFKHVPARGVKVAAVLLLAVAVFQLWITYTIHAYMLMIMCFVFYMVQTIKLSRKVWTTLLGLAISVAIFIPVYEKLRSGYEFSAQIDPDYVVRRWNNMWTGVKGQAYKDVVVRVPKDLPFPFLGAGPGNFASCIGQHYKRPLAEQYINYVVNANSREYQLLSVGGSVTGLPSSAFLSIWSELGPIGWLLYWGCPLFAMLRVWRFLRRSSYEDKYQLILAEAFVPIMLLWLVLSVLADFAYMPFMHEGIWIIAAFVWIPYETDSVNLVEGTGKT